MPKVHECLIKDLFGDETKAVSLSTKEYLKKGEEGIRKVHLSAASGSGEVLRYTHLIDGLLESLFKRFSSGLQKKDRLALVAVGGYGRAELNVRSDIDLMLLYAKRLTPEIEGISKEILYALWDTGLDVGFSIRTIDETIRLASGDLSTMTSLLDRRFIAGDALLFKELESAIKKKLLTSRKTSAFIEEKLEENRQRHEKYGGSVYILEPNIKEGEGGLRDLHTAHWIVKARNGSNQTEPFPAQGLSAIETGELRLSLDFMFWVRNDLHLAAGRKHDQLGFDHQERIAALLRFKDTARQLAVESFMQQYYRHATNILRFSELIISREVKKPKRLIPLLSRKKAVDQCFHIEDGLLHVADEDLFTKKPEAMLRAFEHVQSLGIEISRKTKDLVLMNLHRIDDAVRSSEEAASTFMRIMKGRNLYKTLSEMHRLRLLDMYIPEFADIGGKVQHDLYHIYTVDTHTLFAIRELDLLRHGHKKEFFLFSTLFEEMERPDLLSLGVLLHDIGKSIGKGHAEKGAGLVPVICSRLGLSEDDTETVRFLVKKHLILADTAQYRDLHDERLIIELAKKVGTIERLNMLYLLTFADIRAVGPEVWTQWKAALFHELYFKALTVLERGTFEVEEAEAKLERIRKDVMDLIAEDERQLVENFFGLLPASYFLSTSPRDIVGHMRVVNGLKDVPLVMRVKQDRERSYTELVICTHDTHGLFSMITGAMAANNVNILGARINTLRNGIALDILHVESIMKEPITDEAKLKAIENDLMDVITGRVQVEKLVTRRSPSILDKKARPRVPTRVELDNEVSQVCTVIDIHAQDRIGLLYDITSTLTALGLYIYITKIATRGGEAADIFYVKDIFGQKIYYNERLKEIIERLYKVLKNETDEEQKT
ncbi:MAG: [protein-PII] uridylyltransferase [Deltaproteobacteria bacterium]|nr:[protein-PII] uridylyltransferase [Deltaproteobacteria bacterium]